MSLLTFAKSLYLTRFSKPTGLRPLWREVCRRRPRRIVQLGVGTGHLSTRLLRVASRYHAPGEIFFAGIDLFEARPPESAGLTLKLAHCQLRELGVQVKLVPGDPFAALARRANELTGTDLFLIGCDQDPASLERAWFYVPRMLHAESLVLLEEPDSDESGPTFTRISPSEIERLAQPVVSGRRAA